MKIRKGFVSNSSSSSFVLLTTEENCKKALSLMDEEERKLMDKLLFTKEFLGNKLFCVCDLTTHGGDSSMYYDAGEDDNYYEVYSKYEKLIKQNPDEILEVEMDM
jgi:hypothetical protein